MKLRFKIFSLILAVMVAALATGSVFAWFTAQSFGLSVSGETAGAYFAYGDGSKDKIDDSTGPYGITTPAHLFNLAWLQNTDKIDDGTYFELGADIIEMPKNYVLPPIGNSENPFNSIFNGNGHTIKDLVVSTNKKILKDEPAGSDYAFSNSVGMFGMTGEMSDIKNFILINPIVEVASIKTIDNVPQDTLYSGSDPNAVGLAIGYVGGTASSIGVRGGKIAVREIPEDNKYTTFNSILGAIGPNIKTDSVTGGDGASSGGDKGIFYPTDIKNKLLSDTSSDAYKNFVLSNSVSSGVDSLVLNDSIWINSANNNYLGLGSLSFTTSNAGSSASARVTLTNDRIKSVIYYYNTKAAKDVITSSNEQISYSGKPDKIIDLKNPTSDQLDIANKIVDTNNERISELAYRFKTGNSVKDMSSEDVTLYNEDGTLEAAPTQYNIVSRSIKVNVVTNNAAVFVVAASNSDRSGNRQLGIYKVDDSNGIPSYLEPDKFKVDGGSFSENINSNTKPYQYVVLNGNMDTNETDKDARNLVALEFDLSTVKVGSKTYGGPGAYVIGSSDEQIGIYYVAIKGIEDGNADSGEKVDDALSAIDFVYDGVSIDQDSNDNNTVKAGNFIYNNSLYKASQVRITFNIAALTYIEFSRIVGSTQGDDYTVTFSVTYNSGGSAPTKNSGSGKVNITDDSDLENPLEYPLKEYYPNIQ